MWDRERPILSSISATDTEDPQDVNRVAPVANHESDSDNEPLIRPHADVFKKLLNLLSKNGAKITKNAI